MSVEKLNNTEQAPSNPNTGWESLAQVEFAGDRVDTLPTEPDKAEKETISENLAAIRSIINTEAIAREQNPEGLAEAQEKDASIQVSCDERISEIDAKITEYTELKKSQDEARESGRMEQLYAERSARERSSAHKALALFHLKDKQLDQINAEIQEDSNRSNRIVELISGGVLSSESVKSSIDEERKSATHTAEFISDFEAPLSREQKDKILTFDTLSELSTEEYLKLWRHLNPQYVSHVTRQGYRDHNGMMYHNAGMGEMTTNFTDVLKTGKKLRSAMELNSGGSRADVISDDEAFRKEMEEDYFADGIPDTLLQADDLSPITIAGTMGHGHGVLSNPDGLWRDRTAIHVAANNVADSHYGAEAGNEVFYIFPADVIMSQCSTNQGLQQNLSYGSRDSVIRINGHDRVMPYTDEVTHNDVSVYSDEDLPLDAGLVFLPKSTLVDPNTGSKYHDFDASTMTGTEMTEELGGMPAQEYWEGYFKAHPEEKPSHIIYYDGNPHSAVEQVMAENGIYLGNHGDTSAESGHYLGFDDKATSEGSESDKKLKAEAAAFFTKVADYIRSKRK